MNPLSRRASRTLLLLALVLPAGHAVVSAAEPPSGAASRTEATVGSGAEAVPSITDQAIARWDARVRENPEDPRAWIELGRALMQRSRDLVEHAGFDRAEAAFRKALVLDPKNADAMVGMAWVANTRHEFDDGARWAQDALALDRQQPDAHALLGDAAVERGEYDRAFEHYQASLDLRPDLSSYSRSAHLLHLTGDTLRAQGLMTRAIAAGGPYPENSAWCRAQLARMLFDTGALLPAEQQAERALRDAPKNPHALAALGRIKLAKDDTASAIALLEQAISISPSFAFLHDLATAYRVNGDTGKLQATTQRILDLHAQHTAQHSHSTATSNAAATPAHGNAELARYLADMDLEPDRALAEAELAYREYRNVQTADTLAWCYYKKGRFEDAARTVRAALKWHTPDASILFHAGMIHARLQDGASARKYLYQALSLNPRFHPIHARTAADTLASLPTAEALAQGRSSE